ncbi:hypothetical protein MY11210_007139 [Beauveria gryllotalpidicola]
MFKETLAVLLPRHRHPGSGGISPTERDGLSMGTSNARHLGKGIVWAVADLVRSNSIFDDFYVKMGIAHLPSAHSPVRLHALSPLFCTLFDITPSFVDTNVYHRAVSYLSLIIDDDVTVEVRARLFVFPMEAGAGFKRLLRKRDPHYAKLVEYPAWWTKFRCIVEGLAVRMHLRRELARGMLGWVRLLEAPRQALLKHFCKSKLTQVWPQEVIDEAEAEYVDPAHRVKYMPVQS